MINEVFALNAAHTRTRIGGVLPDAYFEEDSAIDMAKQLAGPGELKELAVSEDEKNDGIVYRVDNGSFTYEVVRLRIAY